MNDVMITDDIAIDKVMAVPDASFDLEKDVYVSSMEEFNGYDEGVIQNKSVNTVLILWIVVAICLAGGIALGILAGKRSANK